MPVGNLQSERFIKFTSLTRDTQTSVIVIEKSSLEQNGGV